MKPIDNLAKAVAGLAGASALAKAHVNSYTRKNGTVVQAYDDKRQAAAPAAAHPRPLGHHAGQLNEFSKQHRQDDRERFQTAAGYMKAGDHAGLKRVLGNSDTWQREKILDHVHPDHWEGLGHAPLNKDRSLAEYRAKFGDERSASKSGSAQARGGRKPAAPKKPAAMAAKPTVKTQNEGYGYHGEAHAEHLRKKLGQDNYYNDASHAVHEEATKAADEKFSAAANHLVDAGYFKSHDDARSFLDSRIGRHLHDAATFYDGDISKVGWLGKEAKAHARYLESERKHSGQPLNKALPQLEAAIDLVKSHIKGYTRKDGTVVKPHEDKRAAAKQDMPSRQPLSWDKANKVAPTSKMESKGDDWHHPGLEKIKASTLDGVPEFSHQEVYGHNNKTIPGGSRFSSAFDKTGHSVFILKHPNGKRSVVNAQGYDYARYHAPIEEDGVGGDDIEADRAASKANMARIKSDSEHVAKLRKQAFDGDAYGFTDSGGHLARLTAGDNPAAGTAGGIEAHGVKGMKSTPWRKTFKSQKHFEDWLGKNEGNVEVHGTREAEQAVPANAGGAEKSSAKPAGTGKHRVQVTVTDPNHPAVTQRDEKQMKTIRVSAGDENEAVEKARAHYKKAGYKVHDHHYIGPAGGDDAKPSAAEPAPAAAPKSGSSSPIDWDSHRLDASNVNAGAHNKRVDKMRAMHEAGDHAGLSAMTFGTNTYGKRQAKLRDALVSHLKGDGETMAKALADLEHMMAPKRVLFIKKS